MNLLLKNTTILENQNPFHKQQVDIEITEGIISKIGKNLAVKEGFKIIGVHDISAEKNKEEIKKMSDKYIYSFEELL